MKLLIENIWETITQSVKKRLPNYVAVAYFGSDGANLLPLKKGDILVVDASDSSVKSGVTNPIELEKLKNKGVHIFSYPQLHSKIFVFGKTMFIGSANVSLNSKENLFEAVLMVNQESIEEAKTYILGLAQFPLEEKELSRLKSIYKAPKFHTNEGGQAIKFFANRIYLASIEATGYSKGYEEPLKLGRKKIIEQGEQANECVAFEWSSVPKLKNGDVLIEYSIKDEMVNAPRRVIHVQSWDVGNKYFVFCAPTNKRRKKSKEFLGEIEFKKFREGFLSEAKSRKALNLWKLTYNQI